MKLKKILVRAKKSAGWATLLSLILFIQVSAQEIDGRKAALVARDNVALETAVDPDEYVIGPGDEILVGLWGGVNQLLPVAVTPEGTVLIPSVGEAKVGGLTLTDAKKEVRAAITKRYPTIEASVTLTKIREVKVKVSGAVSVPGVISLPAYSRASEAIAKAGGLATSASKRNIELVRQTGEKKPVDLLRFERTGEGRANPRVVEGDRIVVPYRSTPWGEILVAGEVNAGGVFEPRLDDSLKILIAIASGLTAGADSAKVERVWKREGKTEREIVDLRTLNLHDIAVRPEEQIFVRSLPGLAPKAFVSVKGEVAFPGYYDIEEGKTKVSEVIARAGGFTPRAILSSAYILRGGYFDPLFEIGDNVNPALIEKMNKEDLNFYLEKNRWKGAVVAFDFVGLFERKDPGKDVPLYSWDEINVPRTSGSVYVLGRVARPGLLNFRGDDRLGDYIQRSGGYSAGADRGKVKILKSVSGGWIKGSSGSRVDAGDVVLVPRKETHFWSTFRDAMAVAGNAAALFFVVREATR